MRTGKDTVKSFLQLRKPAYRGYYVELRNKIAEIYWYVKKGS